MNWGSVPRVGVGLSEGLDGSVFDGRFEITAASDGHVVIPRELDSSARRRTDIVNQSHRCDSSKET
jgi:hypothetical protein